MLTIVGVGPGDPELITLKAINALQAADEIALADSGMESAVEKIAGDYWKGKPVLRLSMPMIGGGDDWLAAHAEAARTLLEHLSAGKNIAYPVLGDPSLYATSSYLLPLIAPSHQCQIIPGIPAMCAAAALSQKPLALGREPLMILPGLKGSAALPEGNVVVMKAGKNIDSIREKAKGRDAYVAQNVGMAGERVEPIEVYKADANSYFTTVIIAAK